MAPLQIVLDWTHSERGLAASLGDYGRISTNALKV